MAAEGIREGELVSTDPQRIRVLAAAIAVSQFFIRRGLLGGRLPPDRSEHIKDKQLQIK